MRKMRKIELRHYIRDLDMTQKDAADEIGCSERQLNRVLNGHQPGIKMRKLLRRWGGGRIDIARLMGDL
jgi:DNA-binding Xre family transcriptional regulator